VYGLLAGLTLLGLNGLTYPWYHEGFARWSPLVLLAGLNAIVVSTPARPWERVSRLLAACPAFLGNTAPYLITPVVVFGLCEVVVQGLSEGRLVPDYSPLVTIVPPGTADYRVFHAVHDQFREPDPLLLWRNLPIPPFSAQRFKGPLVAVPKPPGVFRIICYGDSNTEGQLGGKAWPRRLQGLLRQDPEGGRRYEVMNAGVTGYSSFQGLSRFKQEVAIYDPDLVFVSFGWNDASSVLGRPDKAYRAPSPRAAQLLRMLQEYRSYLLLRGYLARSRAPADAELGPRVSVADYAANLRGFVEVARAHRVVAVLLTRPHVEAPRELRPEEAWRRSVPEYNRALRQLASSENVATVDVQELLAARPELFMDACHLTEEGQGVLASLLHDWILERVRAS
jgi:lysophospholipase L1-like esterase